MTASESLDDRSESTARAAAAFCAELRVSSKDTSEVPDDSLAEELEVPELLV